MEAFHESGHSNMPREAPKPYEWEEIGQRVDDLFQESDREIIRILSQYLRSKGEPCGG